LEIPETDTQCVCFGDTALKNFVVSPEDKLYYIDVFGIYKTSLKRNFVKQLFMIPVQLRKQFVEGYLKEIYDKTITRHLPFYHFLFLVNRIYSKSKKDGRIRKYYGDKKVKDGIKKLEIFNDAVLNEKNNMDVLISAI
jgi:hypothetical protein